MKIGYVGLGAMGASLAAQLVKSHELWVYDLNPKAVQHLSSLGATGVGSLAELADACEVVFFCLPRTSDVQKTLFGPNGLAPHLRQGTLVVDQTSGRPLETAEIADQLGQQGVHMLDAPLSGGVVAARDGRVTIIASGPDHAWEKGKPVLDAMSSKVFRCSSRVGDGQALKLINNSMGACYRMAVLELIALAGKMGIPFARMVELLAESPAASFSTRHMLPARLEGRATTDFSLALMIKDLNEANTLGLHTGAPMPVSGIVRCMMQIGLNTIGEKAVLENVFELVEQLTGGSFSTSQAPTLSEAELDKAARQIVAAAATCNRIAVLENAAVGLGFGLEAVQMDTVLNAGSAWSQASEDILPHLEGGSSVPEGENLGQMVSDLKAVVGFSTVVNAPLLVANSVRAICEAAACEFGSEAGLDALWQKAKRATGVLRGR